MLTQNMLRTYEGRKDFSREKKNRFATALALMKCLKQIKSQRLLLTCAPIFWIPSNISSIVYLKNTEEKNFLLLLQGNGGPLVPTKQYICTEG